MSDYKTPLLILLGARSCFGDRDNWQFYPLSDDKYDLESALRWANEELLMGYEDPIFFRRSRVYSHGTDMMRSFDYVFEVLANLSRREEFTGSFEAVSCDYTESIQILDLAIQLYITADYDSDVYCGWARWFKHTDPRYQRLLALEVNDYAGEQVFL